MSTVKQSFTRPPKALKPNSVKIVHFGVGNFHRAHQAMYLERLRSMGKALEWGICGVGLMPGDVRMRDYLESTGGVYTLAERAPDGTTVVSSISTISEYLFAPDVPEAVLAKLTDPDIAIVSLTITEGGYNVNDATGRFMLETAEVQADLAEGATPMTVFGYIVEGLRRRKERGDEPFTVMSCDNLQGNGHVVREAITAFATAKDPELGTWIAKNVAFPNSMVDRITPATGPGELAFVNDELGIDDTWPVVCEDFTQWVLEDSFSAARPPYEDAGVQVVADVAPYEKMKLRLLNASHQALAYFGMMLGLETVEDAATDQDIARYLRLLMAVESAPTLDPLPDTDIPGYCDQLIARFSNPSIGDSLVRIGTDGSDRIMKFVLPVIRDRGEANQPFPLAAAVVASWIYYWQKAFAGGMSPVPDRQYDHMAKVFAAADGDPAAVLQDPVLFADFAGEANFRRVVLAAYRAIVTEEPRATLRKLVAAD